MAKNKRCGCGDGRNSNSYGCLSSVGSRYRWDNYPYYGGPCPDAEGAYDCEDREEEVRGERRRGCGRRRGGRGDGFGIFTAMLPMAVAANGIVPLTNGSCLCGGDFNVSSGLVCIEEQGAYLATYTVRVPEGAEMNSTLSLFVNDAVQSTSIIQMGGVAPTSFSAQAIFDVCDRATLALRSSEAINIIDTSLQPLVTLSLVKLD